MGFERPKVDSTRGVNDILCLVDIHMFISPLSLSKLEGNRVEE